MKVVIFTQYLKGGGAERRAAVYADYFYKNNIDVSVITMYKMDNEYHIDEKIPRYYVSESREDYKKVSKKQRLKILKKFLADLKPDFLISFLPIFSLYAILATKFSKKNKSIKNIYSTTLYQRKYSFFSRLIDFFDCLYADIISLQCKEQLKCNRLFKKKCVVNYNPIQDRWSDDIERDYSKLSIVSAGRLTKQKNFSLAIKSVALARAENPNISLTIYGDGELKEKLNSEIAKLNASSYIKILPYSENISEIFKRNNMFISSSKYEGFPNSLLEGMMSGLVCLSTPCPTGPSEIIQNGENGFLCKNANEFSKTIIMLSKNPELCAKISKNSRKSAKNRFEDCVVLPTLLDSIKLAK